MVLVHRDDVEAELLAVLQLVESSGCRACVLLRGRSAGSAASPHTVPFLAPGLEVEVGVRHQVKEDYLHTMETNSSGFSTGGRCPQPSSNVDFALRSKLSKILL